MRKVTASAVILTALTGCGQNSGVPSTQWSFKVPSGEALSNPQVRPDKENLSMVSARSVGGQAFGQASGQAFGKSAVGRQMGPAFEQPEIDVASGRLPTASKLGSKEASSLSEGQSLASSWVSGLRSPLGASIRPDPVAQVRAYLRANSPSPLNNALNNRVPYSSQVYLSSQPVAVPSYVSPVPVFEDSSTGSASTVGLTSSLPATALPLTNLPGSLSATNTSTYTGVPVFNPPPSDDASSYAVLSSNAPTSAVYTPNTHPSTSETVRSSEGLPHLTSAVPNDYTALPSAGQSSASRALVEVQSSEDFSGTAILHDLERKSATAAAVPEVAAGPSLPITTATNRDATEPVSAAAPQVYASHELANNKSVISEPTIRSLTQTMPEREISPLVASFRAASGLSQPSQSDHSNELPSSSESHSNPPVLNSETELRSSNTSSPLLEGLSVKGVMESSSPSAIYVPIATAAPIDSSSVLIQQAISALNTEDSISDFINKLAQQNAFSSVAGSAVSSTDLPNPQSPQSTLADSSAAEIASEKAVEATAVSTISTSTTSTSTIAQRIPFPSGFLSSSLTDTTLLDRSKGADFNAFDKMSPADLVFRKTKVRRAALTLAAQQISQRRQQINWR